MTAPPAGELPPLPEPAAAYGRGCNLQLEEGESLYTADQMSEYALLAALRLREGCEALEKNWRSQNGADLPAGHFLIGGKEHNARWALDKCADDLARVLEEGE